MSSRTVQPSVFALARRIYRQVRKKTKRASSYALLLEMAVRNRTGRASVLGSSDAIVSLTTYGSRLQTVAYTIESIARGRDRPKRLVLWLDEAEALDRPPVALRRLERRGLELRKTTNYGPHKKYFPALAIALEAKVPLVTADDDVLYPRSWLRGLLGAAAEHPSLVSCYRANVIVLGKTSDMLAPYNSWQRCRTMRPSLTHFSTGVSGALYPRAMLEALQQQGTAFMHWCPRADDIWLHWTALQLNIAVRQVSAVPQHFPYVPGTQAEALMNSNVAGRENDKRITGLYTARDVRRLREAGAVRAEGN